MTNDVHSTIDQWPGHTDEQPPQCLKAPPLTGVAQPPLSMPAEQFTIHFLL